MKRPSCTLFLDNYQSRDNDNGFKLVLAGDLIIDLLKSYCTRKGIEQNPWCKWFLKRNNCTHKNFRFDSVSASIATTVWSAVAANGSFVFTRCVCRPRALSRTSRGPAADTTIFVTSSTSPVTLNPDPNTPTQWGLGAKLLRCYFVPYKIIWHIGALRLC